MAIKLDKKNYVLLTYSPGFQFADPGLDERFKIELDAKKAGKLRELHADEPKLNHSPYNFHQMSDWMTPDFKIKPEVIVDKYSVPLYLEGSNGEKIENKEGITILETAEDVIALWKKLLPCGDTRIKLDTRFGKDLTPAEMAKVYEGRTAPERPAESDDISKAKMPKMGQ